MSRTNATLISVVAILVSAFSAVPAVAFPEYRSPEAILAAESSPRSSAPVGSPPRSDYSDYRSLEALAAEESPSPLPSVESPASPSDGFDWPSAAVGAGAAMALVALGGAALLTIRRRRAVSPSASTS
jgi:hypothetical protein